MATKEGGWLVRQGERAEEEDNGDGEQSNDGHKEQARRHDCGGKKVNVRERSARGLSLSVREKELHDQLRVGAAAVLIPFLGSF